MKRLLIFCFLFLPGFGDAAETPKFSQPHSAWHGFDRYDFLLNLDAETITPLNPVAGEGDGVRESEPGTRRCILVVPKKFAPGLPWIWRGCYWNHEPQTEMELLRRGYCVAYISANHSLKPDKAWELWYDFLTKEQGLSAKPAFIGMSRGGEYAYLWGVNHPDRVSCIYADNPAGNAEIFSKLQLLAENDVPLLHVNGSIDPLLGRVSNVIETVYRQYGGRISVVIKEGAGHHPHSLKDPKFLADFIEKSTRETVKTDPAFVVGQTTRTAFYSSENVYRKFPAQPEQLVCRGAEFAYVYDKYDFDLPGVEGTVSVIAPEQPAEDVPWVFRAGIPGPDALVDLSLLDHGFSIVVGPVPYNADGPQLKDWNKVYEHLVARGFSKRPILEGSGAAAMCAYAWAAANPECVSCIYAENPIVQNCTMSDKPIPDSLEPLAETGVAVMHFYPRNAPGLAKAEELDRLYSSMPSANRLLGRIEEEVSDVMTPHSAEMIVDFLIHVTD